MFITGWNVLDDLEQQQVPTGVWWVPGKVRRKMFRAKSKDLNLST